MGSASETCQRCMRNTVVARLFIEPAILADLPEPSGVASCSRSVAKWPLIVFIAPTIISSFYGDGSGVLFGCGQ